MLYKRFAYFFASRSATSQLILFISYKDSISQTDSQRNLHDTCNRQAYARRQLTIGCWLAVHGPSLLPAKGDHLYIV